MERLLEYAMKIPPEIFVYGTNIGVVDPQALRAKMTSSSSSRGVESGRRREEDQVTRGYEYPERGTRNKSLETQKFWDFLFWITPGVRVLNS